MRVDLYGRGPCDPGVVPEHRRVQTRVGGIEPASCPLLATVRVSGGRDGAVRPPWIPRSRPRAALAGALRRLAGTSEADARFPPPTVVTKPEGSIWRAG